MKPLRILLAEDDTIIAVLLAVALAELGHDVCAIETTEAGVIGAAARHQPDLLVVDVYLQPGNGVTAVKAVLQAGYIPYLLMSGGLVNDAPPGTIILEKPFDHPELFANIERVLNAGRNTAVRVAEQGKAD
jgi:DNA-binding response OmpR family regulator